jgi:hypothetical protein
MGTDARPRIPVHEFQAITAEWARGQITGAQAQTAIAAASNGTNLDAAEQAEAQALVNTVPTGATAAQQSARALRLLEIDQIMLLVASKVPPYNDPAVVRIRLGLA